MTWVEMEGFVQYCLEKEMKKEELKDLAKRMKIFESVLFIQLLAKKNIEISI